MAPKVDIFNSISPLIEQCINDNTRSAGERLNFVCKLLHDKLPGYDWVGFYIVDPKARDELILGPFVGEPTEHKRIPFGRGVCGRAARTARTVIVDHVCMESDYLACSPFVRSEIVVPVIDRGRLIAEIDVDSHEDSNFDEEDASNLFSIGEKVAGLIVCYAMEEL